MKYWQIFLISLAIVIILIMGTAFLRNASDKVTIKEIEKHTHECGGAVHFVGANKYAYFYECDGCGNVYTLHQILNK